MPPTYDEAPEPSASAFELGRDLPLSFHARTEPSVIAAFGLPPARSPRHEDARNAVLTRPSWHMNGTIGSHSPGVRRGMSAAIAITVTRAGMIWS